MKLNMTETLGEKVKDVAGFGKTATPTFLFFDINGTVIVEHFSKLVNYTDKEVSFVSKNKSNCFDLRPNINPIVSTNGLPR